MMNWKVPAGFAAFAGAVSLLAGIVGGNPFGIVLLRLMLSVVAAAGIGLVINLIINKYLPELGRNDAIPAVQPGEEVDIVIDEDIPLAESAGEQEGESAAEPPADGEGEEQIDALTDSAEADEGILTLEDAEQEDSTEEQAAPVVAAEVQDFENLDTLPDIDQFSPSTEELRGPARPSRMNSQVEEVIGDQDPENLARAVRTVMKKDQ